jgi:hypothetical protein
MPYLIKTTAKEKNSEAKVIELPINPKNRTKLKNLLYVSYPYGAWFTQRLLHKGQVKVSIVDGDAFVDEEIDGADFDCLYELKEITGEEYRAKIMELAK